MGGFSLLESAGWEDAVLSDIFNSLESMAPAIGSLAVTAQATWVRQ